MQLKPILLVFATLFGKQWGLKTRDSTPSLPVGLAEKHQTPQAYVFPDPVRYPEDHCKNFSEEEEFDFVVVGAGPGGATVARRLAEVPSVKVLLLEAGGNPPPISDIPLEAGNVGYDQVWHFHSVESEDLCTAYISPGCEYVPAKMLGGSSIVNDMIHVRGNRKDYDDWEAIGCKGWSYKDVLPYFTKSEKYSVYPLLTTKEIKKSKNPNVADKKYHGTKGPLHHSAFQVDPFTNAFQKALTQAQVENGIKYNPDINGANQMGVTYNGGMVDPAGYRNSAARAFLLHIPDNLKVCKYSTAMRIKLKDKTAVGVEFRYNGTGETKNYVAKAKKEFIISAGPLNSAPLLERSGIGKKDVLEKLGLEVNHELPGVGENYQDHMASGVLFKIDLQTDAAENPLSYSQWGYTSFINTSQPDSSAPDVQFMYSFFSDPKNSKLRKDVREQFIAIKNAGHFLLNVALTHIRHPNPGSIHITQVEDPEITPEIITNHLTTKLEKERITKATRLLRKIMSSEILKAFNVEPVVLEACKQFEFNSEEDAICHMRNLAASTHHNVGMTAMGPKNNPNSVVDPELRLIGIKNVRIVDSGIIPIVTRGNTEIPTVMIGDKAADMIKAFWKLKI